ncbi:putative protein N(5)-glutamine methyltransferase [Rhodococcus sp. IEGM 1379]|uniref:putative protein N(5)-glutamine methyltransferase n=1 Tax=Rhodococcus sp. IEGM 1379 TaxID=3047086 RepID=UPI0024B84C02|nr:putative protein N(5)-glutamine methyltransferase [Rhodococcus sp. IEGM 1379]MDI9917562.1 putative protein N(5)-glutamine methyltransferase [Rhodococcus sp. IEGM 1379]
MSVPNPQSPNPQSPIPLSLISQQESIAATLREAGCVFAEEEATVLLEATISPAELARMIERRIAGEPLESIVGWAEFCGLRIRIDPGVFVPRRRTEFLATQACSLLEPGYRVVDLCCGSGAVGAVLQSKGSPIDLYSVDVEPAAVRCALRNISAPGHVVEGDLYDCLPRELHGRINVIVANAPYVPTDSIRLMPPEARLHEPLISLDGGIDGLDVQRRIAADAATWLQPGGHLLIETSTEQVGRTVESVTQGGLRARTASLDATSATVVIGTKPAH